MTGFNITCFLKKRARSDVPSVIPPGDRLVLLERIVAMSLSASALFLYAVFFAKAGGFWRDEANTICLARSLSLTHLWSALKIDSFPILHFLVVRLWIKLFGPAGASVRALGFTIGLLIIAALWYNSHALRKRAPLISLLLIGMSPVMIRSLESIRPYGIAALLTILAFTVAWRAVQRPDGFRLFVATVVLVLCVQTLYQSAIFVFAMGIAALAAGFRAGGYRRALLLAVPFVMAAASLVPYAGPLGEARTWAPVAMAPPGTRAFLPGFLGVIQSPTQWFALVWAGAGGLVIIAGIAAFRRNRRGGGNDRSEPHLFLYCGLTLVVSIAGFMVFMAREVGFSPQVWHYVPLAVMVVVSMEPLIESALATHHARVAGLLLVAFVAGAALLPAQQRLNMRMTSIDLFASAIEREADPHDLVVITPWYLGVTFGYYYRGRAPWMTFPLLQDPAIHRYDLLKKRMKHPETTAEDVKRITTTLQRGGKIWVVGQVYGVEPGLSVPPLPPAPLPGTGWANGPYVENWSQLLMSTLTSHALHARELAIDADRMINPLESPRVVVFQGRGR